MTLKYKNIYVGKKEEPKVKVPPPNPDAIESLSSIKRTEDTSESIVTQNIKSHSIKNKNVIFHKGYQIIQEGDLHRMLNTKSDYLKDMMDI